MESEGARKEILPDAVEMGRDVDFGAAEIQQVEGERAEGLQVRTNEKVAVVLPPMDRSADIEDIEDIDNNSPEVARNVERMPKEYARHLVAVMQEYKREPYKLQNSVTKLKWDYMGKAFLRKRGDGLDGRAKS